MAKKVVILGAGFGGVRAALDLSKDKNLQVSLVNDSAYHCYHPDLYELASANLSNEKRLDFAQVRGAVNIPLEDIFRGRVKIVIDSVWVVDLDAKTVKLKSGLTLNYDFLILALGSSTNYFAIEGARDYSHQLKNAEDALNIRNDLKEIYQGSKACRLVIVGGGFTGVELAGSLKHFLPTVFSILIVEASEDILSCMPQWAKVKAKKRLEKLGVKILVNCPVKKVGKGKLVADEKVFDFDYLIWTAGVVGNNLDGKISGIEFNEFGKIKTERGLSLNKYEQVYIVGDLAEVKDSSGKSIPATAWAATVQGSIAAKNILAKLKGKEIVKDIPSNPGFVVSIGGMYAITNLFGLQISGTLAWFIKRLVALKYFLSILPFFSAVLIWWKGVKISFNNDES